MPGLGEEAAEDASGAEADMSGGGGGASGGARRKMLGFHPRIFGGEGKYIGRGARRVQTRCGFRPRDRDRTTESMAET